jgi:hypothetical protein
MTLTVAVHLPNVVKMELWTATASWASAVSFSEGQAPGMRKRGEAESVVVMSLSQALGSPLNMRSRRVAKSRA